jgi:hypothetical protein
LFDTLLKALPQLKPAELVQVQQRVSFLLRTTTKTKSVSQDWLLEGLTGELRRRGLWAGTGQLPVKLLPVDYAEKAEAVRQHLLQGYAKPNPRTVECMALGGLAGGMLVDYLIKLHVPVSPKTLLANVEKVPVALEEAFPGYWAQKLLGFCIKAKP